VNEVGTTNPMHFILVARHLHNQSSNGAQPKILHAYCMCSVCLHFCVCNWAYY